MQALLFYSLYPVIYLCSRSPFFLLYRLSDLLFLIVFHLIGYRKQIVLQNLQNAFPGKSEEEILTIQKKFYRHLCDLVVETLKTLSWTEAEVRERVTLHNKSLLDRLYAQNKSIIVVMGHCGNWEWAGPCFSLTCDHQLVVVYNPLTHDRFEKALSKARTKFSTQIIPRKQVLRNMIARRDSLTATALIADQAPNPVGRSYWMTFLNQDTPVNTGPGQVACMLGLPVVFMDVRRKARGYYEIHPSLLIEQPDKDDVLAITEAFNHKLETCIQRQPEAWLWSHRRWKYQKPAQEKRIFSRIVNSI